MDDFEKENAGNDLEVEITDLDAPDKVPKAPVTTYNRRRPLLPPQARVGMSLLTIAGVGVLLLLILVDVLRMPRQAANSTVSASVLPLDNLESVLVADGVAYVGSQHGTIYALRARDGSLLWRARIPHAPPGLLPISAVVDGAVYVSAPDGTTLYVLRTSDGSVLWHYKAHRPDPQNPLVPVVADGITYISLPGESLEALRASNGSLLWRYIPPSPSLIGLPPLVSDGMVYVTTQDEVLHVLRSSDGKLLWHTKAGEIVLGIAAGMVYVSMPDGSLDALRSTNGSLLWHYSRTQKQA